MADKKSIYLKEIQADLADFYAASKKSDISTDASGRAGGDMPGVISLLPIKKVPLPVAAMNALLRVPLTLVRRATHSYYLYQRQKNNDIEKRLERLDSRVMELSKQIQKKETKEKK